MWTKQEATSYFGMFNLNRQNYNHTAHDTDPKKAATKQAILNKDFRQAIGFAFDKEKYSAQRVGEEGAAKAVRNTLTPYDFVTIAGKPYGDTVQSDLQAMNSDTWSKVSVKQGENSTYNVDLAKAAFAKAKTALAAQGVEISKENPIVLDAPVLDTSTVNIAAYASLANSLDKAFDGQVKLNSIKLPQDPYLQAVFSFKVAADADYDFNISGWGPDYADPATYLNILSPKQGDIATKLGLEPTVKVEGEDKGLAAKAAVGMDDFQKLLDTANGIGTDTTARYQAFAKAEAWAIDNGIIIPTYSLGAVPMVQNEVPFSRIDGNSVGSTVYSYKYAKVTDKPVSAKAYEKAFKDWEAKVEEKSKSADKK